MVFRGEACLCDEFWPSLHVITGEGVDFGHFPGCRSYCYEWGLFKMYCVVVDICCQTNKIINVEVHYAYWVDWDVDNQIPSDPKRDVIGQTILSGTRCCAGDWRDRRSQSLLSRIALARLQMDSTMDPHSEGQGAPPKVSQSIIKARPSNGSWMHV
jgi:hypothetical protein